MLLTDVSRDSVRGEIRARTPALGEPRAQIVLYQSLLKADKFAWALQKGTEVGIARFVPIISARCIVDRASKHKLARWEEIIQEAAEQSRRGRLPSLGPVALFSDALQSAATGARARGTVAWIAYESERAVDLRAALEANPDLLTNSAPTIHLLIGPEGGFSPEEVEQAQSLQISSITLGPRILRAETAALVAASALLFALGDMRPPVG